MSVFGRYVWRSLRGSRARAVVCALGIALSCALITAILTSAVSLSDALYRGTRIVEGSWEVQFNNLSEDGVAKLEVDGRTADVVLVREYGTAQLPKLPGDRDARQAGIESIPAKAAAHGVITLPEIETGRMPRTCHELLVPAALRGEVLDGEQGAAARSDGGLSVGTTVTLPLGRRAIDDAAAPGGVRVLGLTHESVLDDSGRSIERIVNARTETFTVVGFYRQGGQLTLPDNNSPWLTGDDGSLAPTGTTAFVATTGLFSYSDVHGFAQLFCGKTAGDAGAADEREQDASVEEDDATVPDGIATSLHLSLLRYRGIAGPEAIWETLGIIIAILVAIVMVASISLIYTGFAISVAERTREYGLLSSLGASRRQLRRTLRIEAVLYAAAGIPIGVLLGLAGTWFVLQITGEALAAYLRDAATLVTLVISPVVIGLAVVISLITIAISALVPALRAGRVSAVEALRAAPDIHRSRAERRRRRRARRRTRGTVASTRTGKTGAGPARIHGALDRIRLRLEGVPGFLAHRNLTRASSKSRVAVTSLAISVALLIITASFASDMVVLSEIGRGGFGADVEADLTADARPGRDLGAMLDGLDRLDRTLARVDGVTRQGTSMDFMFWARLPAGMLDSGSRSFRPMESPLETVRVVFMDDASWKGYARSLKLSEKDCADASPLRAIALNRMIDSDGGSYRIRNPFRHVGTAELLTRLVERPNMNGPRMEVDEHGRAFAVYTSDEDEELARVPFDDAIRSSERIEIAALANSAPESLSYLTRCDGLILLMPEGALRQMAQRTGGDAVTNGTGPYLTDPLHFTAQERGAFTASLLYGAKDSAAASEAMKRVAADRFSQDAGVRVDVTDVATQMRQSRMLAAAVQTFAGAFAIITGLIAVANVFNTLSTSIILRRHEFAVLRSIGMGNRAFLRMIARECASYAVRGLLLGLVLAIGASYAMYSAMRLSIVGLSFELPLVWVAASIGVALLVLTLSVVYALRRCRIDSVAEALHGDVM